MRLYMYGCQSCGVNAVHARRLKAYCSNTGVDLEVKNSKYDPSALDEHVEYLANMGVASDIHLPIVVEGDAVTLLREWRP